MWNFYGEELIVTFPNINFIPFVRALPKYNISNNNLGLHLGAEVRLMNYLAEVLNFTFV